MKRVVPVLVLLFFGGSMALLFAARLRTHAPVSAEDFAHIPRGKEPAALFPAPDFALTSHREQVINKTSLAGQPYVANFIFTTCKTICPLLTSKMVRIQRELKGATLRFVSFSVDPVNDTPMALAEYAKSWNPDESRWELLATTQQSLDAVAKGFRVTAQRTDGGLDAVMHSSVFVLVDGNGIVRGMFDSEVPEDFQRLTDEARRLAGAAKLAPPVVARTGEVLFHELSCANCHEHDELAPALGGVPGSKVQLDTSALIEADDAYLKESIIAPQAKRVRGFTLMMPSYAGQLSNAELDALVAYLHTLPASMPSDATVERDPVCHMKVRVTESTLKSADGKHFCSAWCRDRYAENPGAYP